MAPAIRPIPTLITHDRARADAATPVFAVKRLENSTDGMPMADWDVPASLKDLAARNGFTGAAYEILANEDGVLAGMGAGDDPFWLAAAAETLPEGDYVLPVPSVVPSGGQAQTDALAWALGGYVFDSYRDSPAKTARLIVDEKIDVDAVRREAQAIMFARDLVNTPAGDMLPHNLEAVVRDLFAGSEADVRVIEGEALLDQNFPMIHAVGRASASAPRLIDVRWGDDAHPKVTLIGKGVCFDSGGLNLKPTAGMALMKKDMGGAANALSLAHWIIEANLPVRLRLLIPAVENAVSGAAFRPGDVLQSRKGLTVEIGNTDAEGRLVLADAMSLAGEEDPDLMVTLATLTGAARVALGPDLPPFYCDDEGFCAELENAAERIFDPVWRMPLWPAYDKMLSSPIADMNNAPSGGFAGSILAALFLKRFAPEAGVWGHFDIYAWRPKGAPGRPLGGEAQAIRALFNAINVRYTK